MAPLYTSPNGTAKSSADGSPALPPPARQEIHTDTNGTENGQADGDLPRFSGPDRTFHESKGGYGELAKVKALFQKHYYYSDTNVIDLVLGVVAGNHLDIDPIWLHLIGAPSSGKTELLLSLMGLEEAVFVSDFNRNSLISGYKDPNAKGKKAKQEDYSLLPQLDGKVVVTKDFSIIHDKPRDERAAILSILRDVYDGHASRALGNSGLKGYFSKFNYLTGMTPDVEKSWNLNTLGERFLMYRMQIEDRREHTRKALCELDNSASKQIRTELQEAVKSFMNGLKRIRPTVTDAMKDKIIDLADLLSTCRTYVYRDQKGDLPCLPQAELATRVAKQLIRVGKSVAIVRGREQVTDEEFKIMKRIALDSLPANRREILNLLWQHGEIEKPVEVFSQTISRLSKTTLRREIENLAELGAVLRIKKEGETTTYYRLHERYQEYCKSIGGL
jgi:hypothetical protein